MSHHLIETVRKLLAEKINHHEGALSMAIPLLAIFVYIVYQRIFSPLAKIPGPFWASLTPLWKLLSFRNGNFHETIPALHQKYGKLVRIAPTEVIIADSSAIRQIYSTTEGKDFHKVRPCIYLTLDLKVSYLQ
jgi:hypothetical protein